MTTSEDRKQIFGRQASFPAGAAEFLLMGGCWGGEDGFRQSVPQSEHSLRRTAGGV